MEDLLNQFLKHIRQGELGVLDKIITSARAYNTQEYLPTPTQKEIDEVIALCERICLCGYYTTLPEIAVQLLRNLIKNHYLSNGNKRIACYVFLYFCHITQLYTPAITDDLLMDFARKIAEAPEPLDDLLKEIERVFFKEVE